MDTKTRLIRTMQQSLARQGFHGIGLAELLTKAETVKGAMYHHFPGGKTELAQAAIEATVAGLVQSLESSLNKSEDLVANLRYWLNGAGAFLSFSGFESGCPLATIALETTTKDVALRTALAKGFATIRAALATELTAHGIDPDRANSIAAVMVSTYEGGLMQARVSQDMSSLEAGNSLLLDWLSGELIKWRSK